MIRSALATVKEYLDGWVKERIPDYPSVELSAVSKDGTEESGGKVLLTLVHIEEETSNKAQVPAAEEGAEKGYVKRAENPELNFCLYVLVSAHHSQYETALLYISEAIKAFQAKQVFEAGGNTVTLGLYQMNLDKSMNLWQTIGSKLMPSVMYKLQVVSIQESAVKDIRTVDKLRADFTRDMSRSGMTPEQRGKTKVETFTYTKKK